MTFFFPLARVVGIKPAGDPIERLRPRKFVLGQMRQSPLSHFGLRDTGSFWGTTFSSADFMTCI
jgi:hypothetical protein